MNLPLRLSFEKRVRLLQKISLGLAVLGALLVCVPLALTVFYYSKLSAKDGTFTLKSCQVASKDQTLYRCSGTFRAMDSTQDDPAASAHQLDVTSLATTQPAVNTQMGATYYKNGTLKQTGESPVSFGTLYRYGIFALVLGGAGLGYYYAVIRPRLRMIQGGQGQIINQ